ncbi:YihY/virulence factor BrkB family protein [Streptomyces sp. NBC_00536]|uniref:YihY/virulence factor BrkB family protein n=1 Tax=Streptomyces sp. NBC_00536 TaxID=2975769 RepID=UPI002E80AD35|nr:YihY/virulence factor BrkB family protein [Streptomyces sp. NBC_00536]WUC80798.1 YihY/virulence factor BrkB family protein [Streptomyces sp. NBC_00536]
MDWLTKLPLIGPLVSRLMRTHAWRSYERLDRVRWSRLAAAITFISFLALFPLITVAAAVGAALLTQDQLSRLEANLAKQVPGISDQLDIDALVANAGTVGLVAAGILLFTGIGWVGSMRGCLRAVWDKDDEDDGNPFVRKGKDALVLIGLGGAALGSAAASIIGSSAVGRFGKWLGIPEHGGGGAVLRGGAFAVGVLAAFLLLLYVLTLLPGVQPPRRRLLQAALLGAAGFELLKLLLSGYMREVAAKSMYGAFGVPIALLLWINFTAKLLLFCAAWTATRDDLDVDGADGAEVSSAPRPPRGAPAGPAASAG